jgi:hypothetical protein
MIRRHGILCEPAVLGSIGMKSCYAVARGEFEDILAN